REAGARIDFLKVAAFGVVIVAALLVGWLVGRSGQRTPSPAVTGIAAGSLPADTPVSAVRQPVAPPPVEPEPSPVVPPKVAAPVQVANPEPRRTPVVTVRSEVPASVARSKARKEAATVDRRRFASPTALPGRSFRPSFNCRRATAASNRMIC